MQMPRLQSLCLQTLLSFICQTCVFPQGQVCTDPGNPVYEMYCFGSQHTGNNVGCCEDCRHQDLPDCKQCLQRSPDLVINQLLVHDNPALHVPLSFAQLALCAPQLSCQLSCLNLQPAACKVLS